MFDGQWSEVENTHSHHGLYRLRSLKRNDMNHGTSKAAAESSLCQCLLIVINYVEIAPMYRLDRIYTHEYSS